MHIYSAHVPGTSPRMETRVRRQLSAYRSGRVSGTATNLVLKENLHECRPRFPAQILGRFTGELLVFLLKRKRLLINAHGFPSSYRAWIMSA